MVPDHPYCSPSLNQSVFMFYTGSLNLNWKKYWTKTVVELKQRREIPLCLINQSMGVEVSKFVSLHVETPPAFMDIQEREQNAGKR